MPRRRALAGAQLAGLLALPTAEADLIRHWTLDRTDLTAIDRRRGDHNRLGFALQLCTLRYPGRLLRPGEAIPAPALRFVADQVGAAQEAFAAYSARTQTRYQQLGAIRAAYGFGHLTPTCRQEIGAWLLPVALATTNAAVVAAALLEELRRRRLIVPGPSIVEELVAAALTAAERHVARQLTAGLSRAQTAALDGLLVAEPGRARASWPGRGSRRARLGIGPWPAWSRRWGGCRRSASTRPAPKVRTPNACAGWRARAGASRRSTCAPSRRSDAVPP